MVEKTLPKVFIIESLTLEDEHKGNFEGEIISKILNLSNIENEYFYVRTKKELTYFLNKFKKSGYRYLHISCHGDAHGIATTLEKVSFKDLSFMLEGTLDKRRLFISACSVTNDKLADEIFGLTDCYSIIGPDKEIYMDDAAIFWASFYQVMFKINSNAMRNEYIRQTLKQLVDLHKVPLKYYTSSRNSKSGWREVVIQ